MFYKIQVDWNKYIVLHMNKDTAEAVDLVFGNSNAVFKRDYERDIGDGLVNATDWQPVVSVIRADELKTMKDIGEKITEFRDSQPMQEAA